MFYLFFIYLIYLPGRVFGKFNEPTRQYAQACCDVSREAGTESVDFYSAMIKQKVFTIKVGNFWTPKMFVVVTLKFKQKEVFP